MEVNKGSTGVILNLVFHSFPCIFSYEWKAFLWKFLCCFQTCQRASKEAFPKIKMFLGSGLIWLNYFIWFSFWRQMTKYLYLYLSTVKNLSVAVLDLCFLKHVKEFPWEGLWFYIKIFLGLIWTPWDFMIAIISF